MTKLPLWLKVLLGFVLLAAFGPTLFIGYGGNITGAQFLTGWASFVARNAQSIEFDPLSIATFLFTLGGFAAGVHYAGRLLRPESWRARWTFGIVAACVLLFAAGLVGVGLLHHGAWYATSKEPLYIGERWDGADYVVYRLKDYAQQHQWSTERLFQEINRNLAERDGEVTVRVAVDAAGNWRAILGWDGHKGLASRQRLAIATRDDNDHDALSKLRTIEKIFEYCAASRAPLNQ